MICVDNTSIDRQSQLETSIQSTTLIKYSQRRIFKIIVIGDTNVGKTCLTFRFCGGRFPDKTEATIGVDFREKSIDVDDEEIKVNIVNIHYIICQFCINMF